jgi:CSLREA domain-containing protein
MKTLKMVISSIILTSFIFPWTFSIGQEQEVRYEVIDLGTLGGNFSEAEAINDSGQVTGNSQNDSGEYRAFIWQNGTMQDLNIPGSVTSNAIDINNAGQITGWMRDSEFNYNLYIWKDDDVQLLGDVFSINAMNDHAQLVGWYENEDRNEVAILWENGTFHELGTLGGRDSEAYAINNLGYIVGDSRSADGRYAFRWINGNMENLGSLGESSSSAFGINDLGEIVGTSSSTSGGISAFIWREGVMQDLNDLTDPNTGWLLYSARAINDKGQIIGNGNLGWFLWDNGRVYRLNDLIDPESGWNLWSAADINNSGMIVGRGTYQGQSRAFLLIPQTNIITVNSTDDADDHDPDDDKCNTGAIMANGQPECTLRAAIRHANTLDEPVKIVFDIEQESNTFIDGNPVIAPVAALPFMLNNVTIDATTQPEGSVIVSGASAGTLTDGLRADADSITIKGLTISNFDGYGIALLDGSYHTITGNIIGYNADQTELRLNNRGGIFISDDAHYATIGGSDPDDRNVIAGGISFGESIPDGVKILGNKIEVPVDWLSGEELRVLIGKGANGSPACVPWNESSSNKLPAPRIFDLTDEHVAGMTRPGATVIVYHVLETGSERGRYFPRIVEPLAMGTANQNGQYHISVNLEPEMMISVGAVGADGGSSELSQLKRPVIYAPGIGGSWLRGNNDERLWLPLALSGAEKNNRLARLALNESGNDIEQIRVDGILELASLAGYGPALSHLKNNGYPGHQDNENTADLDLWRFANDWRKNPSDLADSLRSLIEFVLSGSTRVAHSCEVDIVSHSNGGVIASVYVRKHPEHSSASVNRLLTIGTPYLGTPQAAAAHTRGYIFGVEEVLHFNVEWGRMVGMTRNVSGAYGLMPSKKYWEATDFGDSTPGYMWDIEGRALTSYDETFSFVTSPKIDPLTLPFGLNRNAQLWNRTEADVHALIDDWRNWHGPPQIYRMVGDLPASTTIGWFWDRLSYSIIPITHLNIHEEPGDLIEHIFYRGTQIAIPGDGDGTVALSSATLGNHPRVGNVDFSGVDSSPWIKQFEYYPCDHMGLVESGCRNETSDLSSFDRVLEILKSSYTVNPLGEPEDIDLDNFMITDSKLTDQNTENSNNTYDIFYIIASAPIGVHLYDSDGNHTGPATRFSTAVSDSIVYEIPGLGYWPNVLATTVSLDRNRAYEMEIVSPVEDSRIRVTRVITDTTKSNLQVVFPDVDIQTSGSLKLHIDEGGIPDDAGFMVDVSGTGVFADVLEPAMVFTASTPAQAIPSTDRYIYSLRVHPDYDEDRIIDVGFRGDADEGWEWELSGNSEWVQPDIISGSLDQPPSLTVLSTTLPEGTYNDTLKIIVRKDDFERENNIVIRLVKYASVSVDENDAQLPFAFRLYQNYPNPFNPSTAIRYNVPAGSHVLLEVYNILGQRVAVLVDQYQDAGIHNAQLNAGDFPSGVYFYRIQAGDFSAVRKLTLLR